jgi:hypothetical protein
VSIDQHYFERDDVTALYIPEGTNTAKALARALEKRPRSWPYV